MGKAWARDGDVISGAVLSALGLFIFPQAHQWDYSGPDGPGPGFFPTWYGLGMTALSLVMIGQRLRKGASRCYSCFKGGIVMDEKQSSNIFELWLRNDVAPVFDRVANGTEKLIAAEDVFSGLESRYRARKSQQCRMG